MGRKLGIGVLFLTAMSLAAAAQEHKARNLKGWGEASDPDGDCRIMLDGNKLTMQVPGTWHDLGAESGKLNAPRVLRPITGDFLAEVKVGGALRPGGQCTRPGGLPFQGAGLVLWYDPSNYLRLERAAIFREGRIVPYVTFEERRDRQLEAGALEVPEGPTWLRLERRGDRILASASSDGRSWRGLPLRKVDYPARVKIGVDAINSCNKPFTAALEDFRVFRPETL
jgi:regulation of enolase protein 1 (concanavalin A-like superfamily)